jgi:hypothetical protein
MHCILVRLGDEFGAFIFLILILRRQKFKMTGMFCAET